RARRTVHPRKHSRYYARRTARHRCLRNAVRREVLVTGRIHLVLSRQIHPQLNALQRAAFLGEFALVVLGMQDAARGSHPLHVTRTKHTMVTRRVLMLYRTLEQQRHRLEAAVRMWHQPTRATRRHRSWPEMID